MLDVALKAAQIIACCLAVILLIAHDAPQKEPPICDRCKNLYYKRSAKDREYYRYVCKVPFRPPFDNPPDYCTQFEERKDNG